MKRLVYLALLSLIIVSCGNSKKNKEKATLQKPNVVLIYIDDLGYGDISCYGATEISTPNIDLLAEEGIIFSNGHCSSATCTPSRYSMLTGQYAWRQKGTGIAPGDAALIIDTGRLTLADVFKKAGYTTAVVGKWHLGLGPEGGPNWNGTISPGPQDLGFDYSFLIPATGDRVPCVFVENAHVVGLDPKDSIKVNFKEKIGNEPTGRENPELLKMKPSNGHDFTIINGISRIGWMSGGNAARWVDEEIADVITGKALDFISDNKDNPFFLYYSTHDIHVPRVPHPRFAGKSSMGPRGDAILEVDWAVGEITKKLEDLGLAENTIVIFTSDNGPVVDDGYQDQAVELLGNHKPTGPLRGGKYSAFDGGTRVPFIVYWPGVIPSETSDVPVSQIDFVHSFAKMTGLTLQENDAPDSFDMLDVLLGKSENGREWIVEHSGAFSIIKDNWKYIEPNNRPAYNRYTNTELGNSSKPQLYNLDDDLGEMENIASQNPEKVEELKTFLHKIIEDGRSR
ncbi:MAG: arylsulfatase [Draconibacterium sp.]|nr:MAG: arylsulfatase [Draconibacterium sp.]